MPYYDRFGRITAASGRAPGETVIRRVTPLTPVRSSNRLRSARPVQSSAQCLTVDPVGLGCCAWVQGIRAVVGTRRVVELDIDSLRHQTQSELDPLITQGVEAVGLDEGGR